MTQPNAPDTALQPFILSAANNSAAFQALLADPNGWDDLLSEIARIARAEGVEDSFDSNGLLRSTITYLNSAMHHERQPHKWAAAHTVDRTGTENDGGHFYIGSHGIRIISSANSLIVWQPRYLHGTSLPNYGPEEKNPLYLQRQMALVTSAQLPKVWGAFWEQLQKKRAEEERLQVVREAEEHLHGNSD